MTRRAIARLIGVSAATAVGATAAASAAAVRAGLARFTRHPFVRDRSGTRVRIAQLSLGNLDVFGTERFAELASMALQDASLQLAKLRGCKEPIQAILALPSERLCGCGDAGDLTRRMDAQLPDAFPRIAWHIVYGGHSAGLQAIAEASKRVDNSAVDVCLAGAIHSSLCPQHLLDMTRVDEVISTSNPWGIIPGESASFCLLGSSDMAAKLALPVDAFITGTGQALRDDSTKVDVCTGVGLTAAVRSALDRSYDDDAMVAHIFSDYNGHTERAEELGFVIQRIRPLLADRFEIMTPADRFGDVGAAFGPLFLALAWMRVERGYASGPRSLAMSSSRGGNCEAVVLHAVAPVTKTDHEDDKWRSQ